MTLASLRWPLFGLAVVILGAYALARGLYVGGTIDVSARDGADKLLYSKSCRYLHFDGVHGTIGTETHSREDAQAASCALLEGLN
jgi:hypothetical protein